jgi:hypothetical protein
MFVDSDGGFDHDVSSFRASNDILIIGTKLYHQHELQAVGKSRLALTASIA